MEFAAGILVGVVVSVILALAIREIAAEEKAKKDSDDRLKRIEENLNQIKKLVGAG